MFQERIPRNEFGLVNLDKTYTKATDELEKYRINMNDFTSVYGQEEIERDNVAVLELEKKFRDNPRGDEAAKKFATIFESVLNSQVELSEWLGSNAFVMPTSKYDDYFNKVDMVVEFEEEMGNSFLALAIDATFSKNMKKKFNDIKKEIERGEMAKVKYFSSSESDFIGQLTNISRVIVAASPETITNLVDLQFKGKKSELGKHWIQFQILEQLMAQINFFKDYANICKQGRVVKKLEANSIILDKIYKERAKEIGEQNKRDKTHEIFLRELEEVFS